MKKIKILNILVVLFLVMALTGCVFITPSSTKKKIVTSLFLEYDMVKQIIGTDSHIEGLYEVEMIIPAGQDSHTYDPSIKDLITIKSADLFIYTSDEMETWVKDLEFSSTTKVVDLSSDERIVLEKVEEQGHSHDHDDNAQDSNNHKEVTSEPSHEHTHAHEYDPHYWVYPIYAGYMVENIKDAILSITEDPYGTIKKTLTKNADAYINELLKIDEQIKDVVSRAEHKIMYFGCPFSFYYWSVKYDLEYVLTYSTCSTETEPSIDVLSNIINEMKLHDVKVIFSKELINTEACEMISYHTGAIILELHSGHNISVQDLKKGDVTYISIMRQNVINLSKMLNIELEEGGN